MAVRLTVASTTSLEDARALEPEWRTLAARAPDVTPFQYPEWILPWYETWAPDRVRVITVRNHDAELRAVVPTVMQPSQLELAGSGVGDYLGPVLLDSSEGIGSAIDDELSGFHLPIRFNDVPADAAWVRAARGTGRWQVSSSSPSPVAALPETASAWHLSLPHGLRRNLKRYRERLNDDASVRFETIAHEDDVPAVMRSLIELHTKRWHERGLPGVLGDDRVRRFHTTAAPLLARSGLVQLHALYAGREIIGVQYVLVRGARAFSYLAGFDPSWDAYSPGTLLMAYAIEQAIAAGCREFDFLRGREPYKYRWGAVDRCSLSLWRDGLS
jgi:CelD/BcsL family acetyltransferase involved in cellulose biosynthesis